MKNIFLAFIGMFTLSMTFGATNSWAVELPEQTKKSPVFSQAGGVERPENVIVVAKSGGDFTTITDALASLPDPNTTPTIIEVKPGTYLENTFDMKDYIHLQGSGREMTTIDTQEGTINIPYGVTDVAITDMTVKGGQDLIYCRSCNNLTVSNNSIIGSYPNNPGSNCCGGIFIDNGSGTYLITDNFLIGFAIAIDIYHSDGDTTISRNIIKDGQYGMYLHASSNVKALDNEITGIIDSYGVALYNSSSKTVIKGNNISYNDTNGIETSGDSVVSGNTIVGNNGTGISFSGNAVIANNVIADNVTGISGRTTTPITGNNITGNSDYGAYISGSALLSNNTIVNSGRQDIRTRYGTPKINLNTFDTVVGSWTGSFNVKSDGTPW